MLRPLHMAHAFLDEILTDQDLAVDATMGNGHDTLFLAQRAGKVVAFDIQEQALTTTAEKLEKAGLTNAQLVLTGHENLDQYVDECKAAIFNLGYLPSADKSVITLPATTLQAIEKVLDRLVVGGRLAIMVYYGHEGGALEKDAVLDFISQLDQTVFTAMLYKPLNQVNTPPFLVMVERLKSSSN
ncbi:TPA: class I SAM-dependent methyltransferase [Streptococcus suis]|uniref:tRNA (mnm(5)s(2)U34)-methyltransferase n=1 Tax=Streptococcus suis TaxID=1307 RepID=UPI00040ED83C|nr:class I SAM-dependent methyltransferase [Streptococcus suis]MDY7600361.1 class I SAM-dependent methyltransferase [Streptococcus suis]NQH20669.1 methyltransferase domain-containing protein [Streptococcus suis]NQO20515.1 methyltransferase domain-containing protein [Streptococcus suis]NQO24794.1 methyltransferase domain-containing protein [Streptococcus suis]CYU78307.1 SAM-dependent methyltransferase [Streptococcus suis]